MNINEDDIMSRKSYYFSEYSVRCLEDNKKLLFFRIGKYVFKDDVYFCDVSIQNERFIFLFFKLRDRIDNIVFGLYLLSLFRIGKYILNDSNIYVKSLENLFVKFSFFFLGFIKVYQRKKIVN